MKTSKSHQGLSSADGLQFPAGDSGRTKAARRLSVPTRSFSPRMVYITNQLQNFCGLPDYAYDPNPDALVYKTRKPMPKAPADPDQERIDSAEKKVRQKTATGLQDPALVAAPKQSDNSTMAQRKVAHALLTMVKNDMMLINFIFKGGYDAVTRLTNESQDLEVLRTCTKCLVSASSRTKYCKDLFEKQILSNISALLEKNDDDIRVSCMEVLLNMSMEDRLEDTLVLAGVLTTVQQVLSSCYRGAIIKPALLAISNLSTGLLGQDADTVVKLVMVSCKRLDIMTNLKNASFMMDVIVNITRLFQFTGLLCDESICPLMLHLMDQYTGDANIVAKCTECFVNLSGNKKNRREIAQSGVANQLDMIFTTGSPQIRAYALLMVGNLLSSGLFHDKIAKPSLVTNILENMLDPAQPPQFIAVSYCLSQLATVEASSVCLVQCNILQLFLRILGRAPHEAKPYMWNLLVNLSQQSQFFGDVMLEVGPLLTTLLSEIETGAQHEDACRIAYNLSLQPAFSTFLSEKQLESFSNILKTLFTGSGDPIKSIALTSLVNFAAYAKTARGVVLGRDLIDIFTEEGTDNDANSLKIASLLNICSSEENLCLRMLEAGAQNTLVALFKKFNGMPELSKPTEDKRSRRLHEVSVLALAMSTPVSAEDLAPTGVALVAATLHNLSLKRAVLGAGVLTSVLSLIKFSKELRVLHCARALANFSTHAKAKLSIAKEKRLVPILTAIMRSGCEEADRVQHYCSLAVCNVLSLNVEKSIMEMLIKQDCIVDLVVVTRLRVNSIPTKEILTRAIFNLLTRKDFRATMVNSQDLLGALVELSKLDSLELLELAVRSIYNISCQTSEFAESLLRLRVPNILIARLTGGPTALGAKATSAIKQLLAMTMANISFDNGLAEELLGDPALSDAGAYIMALDNDEACYCMAATMYNLAKLPDCVKIDTKVAVPYMVTVFSGRPVTCTQLVVSAFCNFSLLEHFHEELTVTAIKPMVQLLSVPTLSGSVKLEVLKFVYNLVTLHPPCRVPFVEAELIMALWKLLKSQDKDATVISVGRVMKELCTEAMDSAVHKKIIADGAMDILLKLAKKELPVLKLDLSCCIYSLTTGGDTTRVLNWDGVDVMFWLALHDCLKLYDSIRRNVARALRNFSANPEEARILVKAERFISLLKSLSTSNDEDVLWQVAGVVYNMMSLDDCKPLLISRGIINSIFEIASSGYSSVRQVCSACLHMVPDDMPDMDDPNVLQLVLCLLEADGERFAELAERNFTPMTYTIAPINQGSEFEHLSTEFLATWVTITCNVDTLFTPSLQPLPLGTALPVDLIPYVSSGSLSEPYEKRGPEVLSSDARTEEEEAKRIGKREQQRQSNDISDVMPTIPPVAAPQPGLRRGASSLDNAPRTGDESTERVIEPELPSSVSFPKISAMKPVLPADTLAAIKLGSGGTRHVNISESSIQLNKHQNKYK